MKDNCGVAADSKIIINFMFCRVSYELTAYKQFLQIICLCILSIKLICEAIYVY